MMMGRMPPQLRAVARRGSFFWRKAPSGVPKKGIGKLTQKVSLFTGVKGKRMQHILHTGNLVTGC